MRMRLRRRSIRACRGDPYYYRRLREALRTLDRDERRVIALAGVEGTSIVDIARRTGRSRKRVAAILLRALRKLDRDVYSIYRYGRRVQR